MMEGDKIRMVPRGAVLLGDVVISLPRTRKQAAERCLPFKRELALLLLHGILHLLGYDHGTKAREKRMFALQGKLLDQFKV